MGARRKCGAVHQYKSPSATLDRRGSGGAAGVVHERKRGPSRNKEAWHADRMDTVRRFLLVRPFKRPLFGASNDLNPLLDAFEAALAPSPTTGIQNLGLPQMVQHAYIVGKIQTDEGVLGDQAIAIVPVEILCI